MNFKADTQLSFSNPLGGQKISMAYGSGCLDSDSYFCLRDLGYRNSRGWNGGLLGSYHPSVILTEASLPILDQVMHV